MTIEWNKVTWYSKLGALILFVIVVPFLTFYIGREYERIFAFSKAIIPLFANNKAVQSEEAPFVPRATIPVYSNDEVIQSQKSKFTVGLNIEGIDPYDIAYAPVPQLDAQTPTTSPLTDSETGSISLFSGRRFDLGSKEFAYFIDKDMIGYARMGGIPTAITLQSMKSGGTGYFPSLVLYQSDKNLSPKIVAVAPIMGDRITIRKLDISDDHISLTYISWAESKVETANFVFKDGQLHDQSL
ncbi:MAG: hypothetical protein WCT02_02110 [Candidatus Paceibacterota bacterium]